jgi:hypothetical protein
VRHPLFAISLAATLTAVAAGAPATIAQDSSAVALPSATDLAADGALSPDDAPAVQPEVIDLDEVGAAALARVEAFTGPGWDIEELATTIGEDPETAFEFVQDHIGFDPYHGVLRGAHGTLVGRAGNAWDRALLLKALLEAQGHTAQLVRGTLDDETAATVLVRSLAGPLEPLADPDPADILGLDLETLTTRARRDHAWLAESLGPRYDELGSGDAPGIATVADHVWVRLLGNDPVDLDPTFAEMEPGATLAAGGEALDEPPADMLHRLRVAVVATSIGDEGLSQERLLDVPVVAAEVADEEIWLSFQADGSGLGATLLDALGEAAWVPVLSIGADDVSGEPLELGAGDEAADFFFGEGGTPELALLTLELTAESPSQEPITAERILLDRVAPADRMAGVFDAALLAPLPSGGVPVPALGEIHQVLVSNGGADLRAHAVNRAVAVGWSGSYATDPTFSEGLDLGDLFYPLAVANQTIVQASEHMLTPGIGSAGEARAYIGRPRAYLVTFAPYAGVADGSAITTDLALDGVDVVATEAAPAGVSGRVRLWHGVLQQALETELARVRAAAVDPATVELTSVSLDMDAPPSLVTPEAIDTVDIDRLALRDALAGGALALVVDDSDGGAFWAVDPATGRTRSVVEPGLHMGFIGGGNYVNSVNSGVRYVVDPKTGRTLGVIRNGKFIPSHRSPPGRCSGGTEYVIVLGCVSIPASMTVGLVTGVVIVAIVAWSIVLLQLLFLT